MSNGTDSGRGSKSENGKELNDKVSQSAEKITEKVKIRK